MLSQAHEALATIDPIGRSRSELCDQIAALATLEAHLVERRLAVTAAIDALDDNGVDGAGVNRSVGRCSGRRAHQLAESAAALAQMPTFRELLAQGAITAEHVDAAARAAEEVDPLLVDADLSSLAAIMPADLFARKTREWVARNQPADDAEQRHRLHRAARTARSWTATDGMSNLLLSGDAVSMAEVEASWTAAVDRLWHADGGRDGAPNDIRTDHQRRFDALHDLICGTASAAALPGRHPRQQMIVIAEVSQLGADSRSQAAIVDGEPLPRSVLERLACDAEISPVLFGTPGEVLWQGRSTRTATRAQWRALIARDHGCVLCGAGPARCEAHHLEPWSALGATDIDNLALVCARHHHELHDTHSTLTCDDGVWMLRPRAGPLTRAA